MLNNNKQHHRITNQSPTPSFPIQKINHSTAQLNIITLTAKSDASIKATGVRFNRLVTSPTAHMLGILVREYSFT